MRRPLPLAVALAWLVVTVSGQTPSPRTHRLEATPKTVAYGYYWSGHRHSDDRPGGITDVDSSSRIRLACSAQGGRSVQPSLKAGRGSDETSEDRVDILTGPHVLVPTGRYARSQVLSIDFNIDDGYNGYGFAPENCTADRRP
jgi:hypothetical protein